MAFSSLLKSIFGKLSFWRESFSNKAWALEKMRDVFIKELDINADQIETKEFTEFLQDFYDSEGECNLVQYPDFVMNAVSKMVTHVILRSMDIQGEDLSLMLKLLRTAITHGHLDKGQRASTMFECMTKLLSKKNARMHMMSCQFDASSALLFAIGGTQNYTRKSAEKYFVELVKFAFNKSESDEDLLKIKGLLRDILVRLFRDFNKSLMQNVKNLKSNCSLSVIANYCKILSLCATSSSDWGNAIAFNGETSEYTFIIWCDFLKHLTLHKYCDIGDVAVLSVGQLAILANNRRHAEDGVVTFEMLSSLLIFDMAGPESNIRLCDVIVMAYSVVSICEPSLCSSTTRSKLLELSILPLLVVLGVPIIDSDSLCHAIEVTKEDLEKESKTKGSSTLISRAMSNAYSMSKNKELLDAFKFSSTINYLTFKTMDAPENSSNLFQRQGTVSDRKALACLISALKLFNNTIDDLTQELNIYEAENVQIYISLASNFPGIAHNDLLTALGCYRALLRRIGDCDTPYNKDCLVSVLETLELHLVNVDPNLRDTAVKELGQLYLLDHQDVSALTAKVLPSVWKCVRDKEENVVTQVFEFIFQNIQTRGINHLRELLNDMKITQDELMTELQNNLLSRQWENIKPSTFLLYSSLVPSADVIRYAEVCLQHSSSLAAAAVFNFINKQVKQWTDCNGRDSDGSNDVTHDGGVAVDRILNLENRVKELCNFLLEGWGDLVLSSLNGENTTCLRYAVDVLVCLHEFLYRTDVRIICEKMNDVVDLNRGGDVSSVERSLRVLKRKVMLYSKSMLKGSFFLDSLCNSDEINDQSMSEGIGCCGEESGANGHSKTSELVEAVNIESAIEANDEAPDIQFSNQSVEHFDHTKELQPFTLSQKLFYFPSMISTVLPSNHSAHEEPQCHLKIPFAISGFKELLSHLPLISMQREVYQSTDEYDRSSLTILQDINNSLDSSFKILCSKVEKETVQFFVTELLGILERLMVIGEESNGERIVEQVALSRLDRQIKNFIEFKIPFSKFVLAQQRKVLCGEIRTETYNFSSDFFASGLVAFRDKIDREISVKSYFSSNEGIKELLNMYEFPLFVDNSGADSKGQGTNSLSLDASKDDDCNTVHCSVSESSCNTQCFTSMSDLNKIIEELKESIDLSYGSGIFKKSTDKKSKSVLFFELLQRMVETCKHGVTAADGEVPHRIDEVSMAVMYKALDELREYEANCDDGFDRDNDPTAIDCY